MAINEGFPDLVNGRLPVDGSGVVQPVSGTVTSVPSGTQDVNVTNAVLPVNDNGGSLTVDGSVAVNNAAGASAVNIQDGGNSITVDGTVTTTPSGTQNVNIISTITLPVSGPLTDTELRATPVPISGTVAATQSTSPWVVGDGGGSLTVDGTVAVTQTTTPWVVGDGGGSLTVDNNGTFVVQAAQSGAWSVAVNNAAGASAVNIQDGGNSITVDGPLTDVQLRATPVPISGTVTITDGSGPITVDGTVAATQSGTWNINNITGTVSLPTGAATAALQTQPGVDIGDVTINNAAGAAAVNIQDGGNSITVDGPLTDTQLRASPVPISGTVTITDGSGPVTVDGTVAATQSGTWNITNVTGTVSLPTGAATLAEQQTQTASLSVLDDWDETDRAKVNIIVGQAGVQGAAGNTSANTQRVVISTDQVAVRVQGTDASGVAPTTNPVLIAGSDGSVRTLATDSSGRLIMVGPGGVGTPLGGIVTVQGAVGATGVAVRTQDTSGNGITSTSVVGSASTKQPLDVTLIRSPANYYSVPVQILQSAATAANATVFSMRNAAASTRTVYIERILLNGTFGVATPLARALLRYGLCRYSTATPTAGTVVPVIEADNGNAATQVTDVRFLDTGLTTAGVVFETPFAIIGIPTTDGTVVQYEREDMSFELAPGEGFCIRLMVAAVAGQGLSGEIIWSER